MRSGIILAISGLAFLAGCGDQANKASNTPATSKSKPPYQIEFDTKAARPNPAGVTLPAINYTANSKELERRAVLVARFDASSGGAKDQTIRDQMILAPIDIPGTVESFPRPTWIQPTRGWRNCSEMPA